MKSTNSSWSVVIFCFLIAVLAVCAQRYGAALLSAVRAQSFYSAQPKLPDNKSERRVANASQDALSDFDIRADKRRIQLSETPPAGNFRQNAVRASRTYKLRNEHPKALLTLNADGNSPVRIYSAENALHNNNGEDVELTARTFIQSNRDLFRLSDEEISNLQLIARDTTSHNKATHLTFQQRVNGMDIFQAQTRLHFNARGDLIAVTGELIPDVSRWLASRQTIQTEPTIDLSAAIRLAMQYAGKPPKDFALAEKNSSGNDRRTIIRRNAELSRDAPARLIWFPLATDKLALAWEFELWMADSPEVYLMLVDAERGSLLYRHNLTTYEFNPLRPHGLIFTGDSPRPNSPHVSDNPTTVSRQDVEFHAAPFHNLPGFAVNDPRFDWWAGLNADSLISNNVEAHLDRDANNISDIPPLQISGGNFNFPLDLSQSPVTANNQKAAQVNLFYWVNRYHDILYAFGFTEAAGNFQTNNFNLDSDGSDAIQADAQDGSGINNANFTTPPDGRSGRVQMYLWDGAVTQLDGSFDQGVILHELTHGLSNRLIGNSTGLTGFQARAMGEGWSDFLSLTLLSQQSDPLDGAYAIGQYVRNNYQRGIRRFAYSTNPAIYPYTFASLSLSNSVHASGEIWCNALWEMRAKLIEQYGFHEGQRQSIQLVVDGMKLTPVEPDFLEARDAILLADRLNNNGTSQCLIWQAFARRGMGAAAVSAGTSDNAPTAAFDVPPYCSTSGTVQLDRAGYVNGEMVRIALNDINAGGRATVKLTSSATGDEETITLSPVTLYPGSYTGMSKIRAGAAIRGDGFLQASVDAGDQVIASYADAIPIRSGEDNLLSPVATAAMMREKILFEDNAESSNQGWISTGAWATAEAKISGAGRAWTDSPHGNYANSSDVSLISPVFDLTGYSEINLIFNHKYNLENRYDFGIVECSADNGSTWTKVTAYTGTLANFTQTRVLLNGLSGKPQARIRFRLLTDSAQTADGWWIDGIRISGRSANASLIKPGNAPSPLIASITPAFSSPAGNVEVVITGSNFTETEDTAISFDGLPALSFSVQSSQAMVATVPPHTAGAVTVRVTNRHGTVALSEGFTYFQAGQQQLSPVLEKVFPDKGSIKGGTIVTLTGQNFTPDAVVTFASTPALMTFVNAKTLRVMAPSRTTTGRVNVTLSQSGSSSEIRNAFEYTESSLPSVQVLSPQSGEPIFTGSTLSIRWQSADNHSITKHRVSLMQQNGQEEIATDLSGETQSLNWIVPATIDTGTKARIRIIAVDDEGAEAAAFSGEFMIARRWEAASSLPYRAQRLAAATDGRFVYAIGGRMGTAPSSTIESLSRFDPLTNLWSGLAPMPTGLSSGDAVFLNGLIYVPGGFAALTGTLSTKHLAYSVAENSWKQMSDVPVPTYSYALAADESRRLFYLTGGSNSGGNAVASVRSFNPQTNNWSDLPAMKEARYGHEAALIDGRLYVTSGFGTIGGLVSTEVFDFNAQKWTSLASLNKARRFAISTVIRDANNYPYWLITGGDDPVTAQPVTTAELYDVPNNRWITLDNSFLMLVPRSQLAGVSLNGKFYAIGGATITAGGITTAASAAVEMLNTSQVMLQSSSLPPAIAVPSPQSALAGREITFNVSANSLNLFAPLEISCLNLPAGASLAPVSNVSGKAESLFRWTPSIQEKGRAFTLNFLVSDGFLSEMRSVTIRVIEASLLTVVSAASYQGSSLSPDSIVTAFGSNLAVRTELSRDLPLALELAGTYVTVNGVRAPLFFVSPSQINFAVPAGIDIGMTGEASVIVSSPDGEFALGVLKLTSASPSLFTFDASGKGEAAALATTDGLTYQQAPYDVSINGRPNMLAIFGTGFRHATTGSSLVEAFSVSLGGIPARVIYAGAQGGMVGLDQLNIEIPQALQGDSSKAARSLPLILSVNGIEANRVTITIK
jgi:uncharacterized protein (TIGR03437 family)